LTKQIKDISQPHDKVFKFVFSDKAKVEHYLRQTLTEELTENIDFNFLTLDNNSYIDEELKGHYSDVVYEAVFAQEHPIKIAILFEHKSYTSKFPHLQLLNYKESDIFK
jgi:predicted transposase/invertase (TIGR01784 family)